MLRFLLWRLLGLLAVVLGVTLAAWLLKGGLGGLLRGHRPATGTSLFTVATLAGRLTADVRGVWSWAPVAGIAPARVSVVATLTLAGCVVSSRWQARRRRRYVRLQLESHRTDHASAEAVVSLFEALHKRLLLRWWRRLLFGQPTVALEVHYSCASAPASGALAENSAYSAWMALTCLQGSEPMLEAALRTAYPNCRLRVCERHDVTAPALLRLKKSAEFIKRVKALDHFEHEREPAMNRLLTAMGATGEPVFVQLALTPTPACFERFAKHLFKRHEARLARERREHLIVHDRSMVEDAELRGALAVQHRPLFFVDLRVGAHRRAVCEQVAAALRAEGAENRLVERGTGLRHGLLALYRRRVQRGEGNPLPPFHKGVLRLDRASPHLASAVHRLHDGALRS